MPPSLPLPKFGIGQTVYERHLVVDGEICEPDWLEPGDIVTRHTMIGVITGLWHDRFNAPGWSYPVRWHTRLENDHATPCDMEEICHEDDISDR